MDYFNSPSNKAVDNIQYPEEMKFKTPKNNRTPQRFSSSPDFAPFNVSSPVKSNWKFNNYRGARNKRYFNTTDSGSSHSGNFNSPFNKHRRMGGHNNFGRGGYRNNRHNKDAPISSYMDASMTEDPWMDLERDLLSSRQDKTTSSEPSMTSNSPNLPDEDENNQIR